MIPSGNLETGGRPAIVANILLEFGAQWPIFISLIGLFVLTMLLSNVVNNAAAALLMAPISASLAQGFNVSLDPFLMVVAVEITSCAFLTPIGHRVRYIGAAGKAAIGLVIIGS